MEKHSLIKVTGKWPDTYLLPIKLFNKDMNNKI